MKRLVPAVLALFFSACAFAQSAPTRAPPVALKGTDPITYFNPGKPAKGASSFAYDFDDARYHFSSAKNKELFAANPDKYAPQFTGLCATGLGMGMKAQADPNIFTVQDGKLYVFSSAEARDMVQKDPTLLKKAHQTWNKDRPGK